MTIVNGSDVRKLTGKLRAWSYGSALSFTLRFCTASSQTRVACYFRVERGKLIPGGGV